jgi:alkenylglycerophosphocholine/alkenylglycerophosphoethanolamine hydrolase
VKRVLAAYLVAIGAFTIAWFIGFDALRVAAKPIPVALLAVSVARAARAGPMRSRFVFGLALCAVGDWVLETGRFVPGLVAFLVGHLGYVAAFLAITRELRPARAVPFVLWGAVVLAWLWSGLGALAIPVALYTATICTMMWRAVSLLDRDRPWATSIAIGAVVFAASDTLIAVDKFHAPIHGARVAILALYWLGQWLIARGAMRAT